MNHAIDGRDVSLLEVLARHLITRKHKARSRIVIAIVGAGASQPAGFPGSWQLARKIRQQLLSGPERRELRTWLQREAESEYGNDARLDKLDLFQLAALLSRLAQGRRALARVVRTALAAPSHVPLAYELIAHLAKHGFIDHAVSLNFDTLLDVALRDELAERYRVISRADHLPGPHAQGSSAGADFLLIKPFGSLGEDCYDLSPDHLQFRSNHGVWRYLLEHILGVPHDNTPITLMIMGYQGNEQAFQRFMSEVLPRSPEIHVFDPLLELPVSLRHFQPIHVRQKADDAMSLLVQWMRHKYLMEYEPRPWPPTARHEIVAKIHTPASGAVGEPETVRFQLELLLQAVRSRGFVSLEAFDKLDRISHYGSKSDRKCIDQLAAPGTSRPSAGRRGNSGNTPSSSRAGALHTGENYFMASAKAGTIAEALVRLCGKKSRTPVEHVVLETIPAQGAGSRAIATRRSEPIAKFVADRIEVIQSSPDIEVSLVHGRSTRWMFHDPEPLGSLEDLVSATAGMLEGLIRHGYSSGAQLWGIWNSGEWLFHRDGWGYLRFGQHLEEWCRSGGLTMRLVLAEFHDTSTTVRKQRAQEIYLRLTECMGGSQPRGSNQAKKLHWWGLNRIMTVVSYPLEGGGHHWEGVYMRRRHLTPLVAPVHLRDKRDCEILLSLFDRYSDKADELSRQSMPVGPP